MTKGTSTKFQRWVLPAFAFKAVVIGGGYATGRELAEYFMPSGPRGGLLGMVLAAVVWSVVAAITFIFAYSTGSTDYRTFFQNLLGPAWVAFEVAYVCMLLVILSVFAAAAGAIGAALFGWHQQAGTILLILGIAGFASFGNVSVERLFKYVTVFLYAVYAVFVCLACTHFWDGIVASFARPTPTAGWLEGGLAYSAYNVIGAVIILPTLRHLTSTRDAVVSGLLCGPLAMLPAMLFFIAMTAFYPAIGAEILPSDVMLRHLDLPLFHLVFQLMIFAALLESGTGFVHAINERLAAVARAAAREFGWRARLLTAAVILAISVFVAARFGLVTLIASGYRLLACVMIAVYVLPLITYGVWQLTTTRRQPRESPL